MADTLHGSYIASSNVLDIQNLDKIKSLDSPEFKVFLSRLRNILNNISTSTNSKISGYYPLTESVTGKKLFPDPSIAATDKPPYRDIYLTAINFGALPNNTTKSVAHGLTIGSTWSAVGIYGAATDQTGTSWIPIPYAGTTGTGTATVTGTADLSGVKWEDSTAPVSATGSVTVTLDSISIDVDGTNVNITTTSDKTAYTICYIFLEYIKI